MIDTYTLGVHRDDEKSSEAAISTGGEKNLILFSVHLLKRVMWRFYAQS